MNCDVCEGKTKVTETRVRQDGSYVRMRCCLTCPRSFLTKEIIVVPETRTPKPQPKPKAGRKVRK